MQPATTIVCPLCNEPVNKLLYRFHIESEREVINNIKLQNPLWTESDGICSRCVDYYHTEIVMLHRVLPGIGPHFPVKSPDDFIILPTPLRLDADPRYTGKGVTICFIDSGFYRHPDLVTIKNRIKTIVDILDGGKELDSLSHHEETFAWHGTMTSVVCAGDGFMSNGLYRGIASDAELVLLKVQDSEGKIRTANIASALDWIKYNHKKYNIKIVNISLSADETSSYKTSVVDQLAEELINAGITIVAAVGNDETSAIKPPANSLNVIAVGGIDDNNEMTTQNPGLYHSSFGKTEDGLMKPELTANAIWIAAPVLPGTPQKAEAEALQELVNCEPVLLAGKIALLGQRVELGAHAETESSFLKEKVKQRIQQTKFFSSDYMHVDGTSFAAPIVSSVIAQLLEAEPTLTPFQIRHILFSTAKQLPSLPIERQGFGYISPRKAVLKILKKQFIMKGHPSPFINRDRKIIEFYMQHSCAEQVSLCGSFNNWAQDVLLLEPGENGLWKIEIPLLPNGKHFYKFCVDERVWLEDVDNPWREPDGVNGWNSVLLIEN